MLMTLQFDPFDCDCEDTAVCFRDDVARILYLLWRSGHLVDKDFPVEVLEVARRIRQSGPGTVADLRECFRLSPYRPHPNFLRRDVDRFCLDALPYFTGEKGIDYEFQPAHGGAGGRGGDDD
jgi:hypothetical protein